MFGFSRAEKLQRVYRELAKHPEWISKQDPRGQIPLELTNQLFAMSKDVTTTVWLLLIWQQEYIASQFVETISIQEVVSDFRAASSSEDEAISIATKEVDGLVESAQMYGKRVANMMDDGVMVGNLYVRQYCAEKLTRIMAGWMRYRLKVQSEIGAFV